MELIENQPSKGGPGKSVQPKLPPLPLKSPLRASQSTLPSRVEQVDPKRRREQKGNDVVETGRLRPTNEKEAQRAAKQQKVSHAPSWGAERDDIQPSEPQAWLPAPMLGGEPLMDDTSIRDFNRGIGCHVASTLELTLLLTRDMLELRGLRKNEVFLNTKRYLGMVWCYLPIIVFLCKTYNCHAYIDVYFLFVLVLIHFFFSFFFLGHPKYF